MFIVMSIAYRPKIRLIINLDDLDKKYIRLNLDIYFLDNLDICILQFSQIQLGIWPNAFS